ncbi:tetraspanin-1-like [Microplitis mediator]|uniref:tetraspanin-1-like n=1 Tax=Microplitis mediator TaxID=375433 RepID=UPI0025563E64|nr:tetraspanin-1-like [Microplitis mediator]XP_057339113.1 tetraspanin-1-like [Microplitis mediator]XP_057339114.1 tetraspanin-1-like [Microplitis mediator]
MSCTAQFAKCFLCLFNFVFFIAGGAALTVGIWLVVDSSTFTNLVSKVDELDVLTKTDPDVIKTISYILIVTGALTFIVSFMGYCGAMFESRCLLCVYGILILAILILECTVVGLAFGLNNETEQGVRELLKSTIKYYATHEDKTEAVTLAWDAVMNQMTCCGVDNYMDFQLSSNWSTAEKSIPEACCYKVNKILKDPYCTTRPSLSNSYYMQGCYNALVNAIKENAAIVIGVAVTLAFVEILVIVLALYLACCYWRPQHVLTCWCCC